MIVRNFFKVANCFCFVVFITMFIVSVVNPNYYTEYSKLLIYMFSLSFAYLSYSLIKVCNKIKD